MILLPNTLRNALLLALAALLCSSGCARWRLGRELYQTPAQRPLGSISDSVWQRQEFNAEASDFVVYQHEFVLNGVSMNTDGENHLQQIAARLHSGQCFPVLVERSMTSYREDTEFQYPVHPNPELDMQRREVVVRGLVALGIADAEQRVLVAPALAEGYKATEAAAAYYQMATPGYGGYGGYGGGFGGGFGGGMFTPFSGFGR